MGIGNADKPKKCFNCKHGGGQFKIAGKTHLHCEHPKYTREDFKSGKLSPWDTLMEFWHTCDDFEFKVGELNIDIREYVKGLDDRGLFQLLFLCAGKLGFEISLVEAVPGSDVLDGIVIGTKGFVAGVSNMQQPEPSEELGIMEIFPSNQDAIPKLKHEPETLVSSTLTIEEVAARYGQKLKCKWLTPDGNDWLEKEMIVDAHFLREMEQRSIKECY